MANRANILAQLKTYFEAITVPTPPKTVSRTLLIPKDIKPADFPAICFYPSPTQAPDEREPFRSIRRTLEIELIVFIKEKDPDVRSAQLDAWEGAIEDRVDEDPMLNGWAIDARTVSPFVTNEGAEEIKGTEEGLGIGAVRIRVTYYPRD